MLRPNGYTFAFDISGRMHEAETFMCGHCNAHHEVLPYQRPEDIGGLCKCCMKLTCPICTAKGDCHPFEKKLEEWESGR